MKPTGAFAVSGDTGLPGQVLRSGGPASTAQWQPLGNVLQTQFNNSSQASTLLTAASQTFTFTAHSYNVVASGDARLIIDAVFFFRNPGCFACPESQDRIFVRVNGVEAKGYHFVYTPNNFCSTFTVGNLMYDVPPGNHAITFDAFHYSFAADSYAFIDSSSVMVLPR